MPLCPPPPTHAEISAFLQRLLPPSSSAREQPMPATTLTQKILAEFNGIGELHQLSHDGEDASGDGTISSDISVVAIMNAFHGDEIHRVLETAREKQWIDPAADGRSVLYLTGAARDYGLAAIKEVRMPAFCVGHRACEEWGIRYLAQELRAQWPGLEVIEVLEEEEMPASKKPTIDSSART